MIPLGLTGAQQQAFHETLADSHEIRIRPDLLGMETGSPGALSPLILPGSQVNVDGKGETSTRTATVSLLDPDRTLPPAIRQHRMRIYYDVYVDRLNLGWVEVPLITGPITSYTRNDAIVDIEISGADYDASVRHTWVPLELPKGMKKTVAIRKILTERAGFTRIVLPDLDAPQFRMPKKKTLGRLSHPWLVAKKLARSMDRQLYVDGFGTVRMRKLPHNKPQFVFRDGDGGMIASEPVRTFTDDADKFANGVWATGRVLKGAKKPLEVRVWAPRDHPLSPWSLATNGIPFRVVDNTSNPGFRSTGPMLEWAKRRLHEDLQGAEEIAVDVFVAPHMDAGDLVAIRTDELNFKLNMHEFSIPLEPSGLMSAGYHRDVSFGPTRGGATWEHTPKQHLQIDHGPKGHIIKKKKHPNKQHHKDKHHHHHKHGRRQNRPGPRHA